MVKWNAQTYSSTVCEQSLMGISFEYNLFLNGLMECPNVFISVGEHSLMDISSENNYSLMFSFL